ncbi:MAG TPA: hypothetical protein VFS35_08015 [Terrimicrobiaceae bacterium]|nr:hypothetical protein [Terrimicrobiaceae bacterium]
MEAGTYIPIAVGAVVGAVGSALVILRGKSGTGENHDPGEGDARRLRGLRIVLAVYAATAGVCLVVAIAQGDGGFIVTTGLIAVLAVLGLWRVYSHPPSKASGDIGR